VASSDETPTLSNITGVSVDRSSVAVSSNGPTRVDTLAGLPNPYGLPLPEEELRRLASLKPCTPVHRVVGFLCGALTVPEPLPPSEWIARLDDRLGGVFEEDILEDGEGALEDREIADEFSGGAAWKDHLAAVAEYVQRVIDAGDVASLIPVAKDAVACRTWARGFEVAACSTLHDLSNEEAVLSAKLRDMGWSRKREPSCFDALHDDVAKLIALWREVPPYDPASEAEVRTYKAMPQPVAPSVRVVHSGETYKRSTPKVGRNDLCPCGSGKKYKKCCG